ncbi:MAG: hypothetical protein JSR85_06245 [Proteobacteria bacterium]|nr:hypothetical protein [Pseudomonadota bacterium]
MLFYISNSKTFHLCFLVFVLSVFLFSFGEFLNLKITTNKPYGHAITPDSVAFEFKTKPNIYFLLFDAYPRHDTLLSERDNSLFLSFFKVKEFIVADKAYSNYAYTWPSLSSMFQMSYLREGDVVRNDVLSPLKEVFVVLKKNNYDIAVVSSHYSAFNANNVADSVYYDSGIPPSFASSMLNYLGKVPKRVLNIVVPFFMSHMYFSMNEIENVASLDKQKPLFTFIHFVHFHDYVFNSNCEIVGGPQGIGDVKLNSACFEKLVEKSIDVLVSKDPNAIIIAQSDHGPWYWYREGLGHPDRFNRGYGIFSAFRLPNLDLSEDIREYLQDTPSPVNNFRIIFALLAAKKPELLSYRAFVSEPSNGMSSEFVAIEEKIELEKVISNLNYLTFYHSLKNSATKSSNEGIVRFLLEREGYKKWSKLSSISQEWVVAKIVSEAQVMNLKQFLAENNYSKAYRSIKDAGNKESDEEIIRFLLESNGYKNWYELIPISRKWVVNEIVSKPEGRNSSNKFSDEEIVRSLFESNDFPSWSELSDVNQEKIVAEILSKSELSELNQFLAKQDYSWAYRLAKDSKEKEIVKNLLESKGYKNWNKLSAITQKWVVTEVMERVEKASLTQFLADEHDYAAAYSAIKSSGNEVSNEEVVRLLLEREGYKNWCKLRAASRAWVVAEIVSKAERIDLDKFLTAQDYSVAYRSTREAGNLLPDEEIVKFLFESNGYPSWSELSVASRKWVVDEIVSKAERMALEEFLAEHDYSMAYRSVRGSNADVSDEEIVKSFLERDGYKNWGMLSSDNRKWVVAEIVSKAERMNFEKFLAKHNYPAAYRLRRDSGGKESDEEIVRALFKRKGYKEWKKLSFTNRKWVVAEIVSKAERMALEEFLAEHDYSMAYRSIRSSNDNVPNEVIVKSLLKRDGYKGWSKLSFTDRKWAVSEIVSKAERMKLEKFLTKHNYPAAYRLRRDSGSNESDEEIVRSLFKRKGYKKWKKLSSANRKWVVSEIISKAERMALEEFLAAQDYSLSYRSIRESGANNPPEVIVKFLLESNGYRGWSKLSFTDRQEVIARITLGTKRAE